MNWSKASIVAMCLIASLITNGQSGIAHDTLNQVDSVGNKQGWWIEELTQIVPDSDTTETTIGQGRYLDDTKIGDWTTIYKGNGVTASYETYSDGMSTFRSKFDARGRLRYLDSMDLVSGTEIHRSYRESGVLATVGIRSSEKSSGTTYWENGNVRSHWERSADLRSDEIYVFLHYWEDGTVWRREEFIGDRIEHGTTRRYYRNGRIQYECQYVFGKLNGEYKKYDEEGNLTDVAMWANGVRLW
jgi:antitoxin component YwqK of YwqJK toxin-antitoxin module